MLGYSFKLFTDRLIGLRYLSALGICLIAAFVISSVKPDYHFAGLIAGKRNDMIRYAEKMDAKSLYDDTQIERNWSAVMSCAPKSMVNAIIQPLPHSKSNVFQWIAFIENLLILSFLIYCIIRGRAGPEREYVWFIVLFVAVLYLILGLTTPVAGALVRYKVPGLVMSMILCLLLHNKKLYLKEM